MNNIINLHIKQKVYKNNKENKLLLNDFKLTVNYGEKIAIIGESGIGKTTLLNILGLIDNNFEGEYKLFDEDITNFDIDTLAKKRNNEIGFVLQSSALINSLTIEENIKLPLIYSSSSTKFDIDYFNEIVERLNITSILKNKPNKCSTGERSRAVFARAVIMKPKILLCDEPTASLDLKNRNNLIAFLFEMNEKYNTTIITVTHDLNVANLHDSIIEIT